VAGIAARYDALLFDLDGVLFRGDRPLPHASETVAELRRRGDGLAFLTNNSSRTPAMVVEHLASVGIDASPDEVETSALTTAATLAERGVTRAFVIGEAGLRGALADAGIAIVGADAEPDVVAVGWDRSVDYDALRDASVLIQGGAALIGSNADASYPTADGPDWPGTGAILAAIETATGTRAEVMGKPNGPLFEHALRRAGGGRPLVIGDRIDTDVDGAARLGWDSLLVLTGITSRADLDGVEPPPTYVAEDLRILVEDAAAGSRS